MREASRIARLVIEKLERSSKSEKPISYIAMGNSDFENSDPRSLGSPAGASWNSGWRRAMSGGADPTARQCLRANPDRCGANAPATLSILAASNARAPPGGPLPYLTHTVPLPECAGAGGATRPPAHIDSLRAGVASAAPKAIFDPQLAIQLHPGQRFLHLKQLAADPVLDQLGLRSSAPCLFQATFDLPTGARFSISDTSRVADGELKNVCQSRIAMVQTIIDGPPRQGPQKHHPACGMPRHSVGLSSRHCVYLK